MQPEALHETKVTGNGIRDETGFSLVRGGPLYKVYLRTGLARPSLEFVTRRIVALSLLAWLPPFLLAALAGHLSGGVRVPFLFDVEVHTKFLAALPLLIAAELVVHQRIRPLIRQFLDRGIIAPEDRARFDGLLASVTRLESSGMVELLLLLFVVSAGHWVWRQNLLLGVSSWYGAADGSESHLTAAGYYYAFVSLPILRFLVLRWYFRLFIWYRFLWQVRALPLHLNLFHPDRAGGLGFLEGSLVAFAPTLAAQTIVMAGMICDRIWYAGATLRNFEMEIAGAALFLMFLVLTPLSFFAAKLDVAGRIARLEFGDFASRYVSDFRRKWILGKGEAQPVLGTADIQSLADLGNTYNVVNEIGMLPFTKKMALRLAIAILLPFAPLILTLVPLHHMIERLIQLVL